MKVPELTIERYVAGAANSAEIARVEGSPEAMARVAELRRDNEDILFAHPPKAVATRIHERVAPKLGWPSWRIVPASAIAAMCCVCLVVLMRPHAQRELQSEEPEVTRAKGMQPQLAIYRQRESRVEKLARGATARVGDTLQVAYIAGDRAFGAIVSVDGRANTTIHPLGSGKLSQAGEVVLPRAYTLDDAPRFERFVFVAASTPVDVARVARVLHASPEADVEHLRRVLGEADVIVFMIKKANE